MSVIVVGMKMPKNCAECPCEHYECLLLGKDAEDIMQYFTGNKRHPDCPLIDLPPHGDLIDYNFCLKNYELLHDDDGNPVYAVRMRDINAAPVIIEAEEVSK